MKNDKILMIDNEWSHLEILRKRLENQGFVVLHEADFVRGFKRFVEETPSFVMVNISSGDDVNYFIAQIRKNSNIPIVVLGENTRPVDRITALEIGADDYVSIPFDMDEVIARVRAVMRRYTKDEFSSNKNEIILPGLRISKTDYEIVVDGIAYELPSKELNLIYLLASNPNIVFTREQLMDRIWGFECYSDLRTVDVHIKRLREKIKGHEKGWAITTVRGVGYKFSSK